ncbi:MAG TPA: FAD-dependent oxidoreductase, partial [Acidimicrobiales bacterium]|nr:FAD-dependent oxidoreductase [Acidimicrobiales bacterium]
MSSPLAPDAAIVVIGASLAGLRAAEEVRHEGHTGPITVIGDEPHVPYDRPPLSKQVLAGRWDVDRIHHHAPDKLDTLDMEFRLGRRADALDVDARTVSLDDGTELHYDGLIIATGARARSLPGTEGMPGVRTLRTLDDAEGLIADLAAAGPGAHVVVIGAGFIGSEVAATCRGLGFEVTVVEALPTPLGRVLGDQMGAACAALHADAGVVVRTGVGVDRVVAGEGGTRSGSGSGPVSVHLDDGEVLQADVVVVGIGVTPAVDWLAG